MNEEGMVMRLLRHLFPLLAVLVFSSAANAVHSAAAADSLDEADDPSTVFVAPQHPLATGQIVAVNRAAGTITIRHKPIPDVFMTETMTMIFRVADKSMLEGHRSGDRIRFKVERTGRNFVVVWIENSN